MRTVKYQTFSNVNKGGTPCGCFNYFANAADACEWVEKGHAVGMIKIECDHNEKLFGYSDIMGKPWKWL